MVLDSRPVARVLVAGLALVILLACGLASPAETNAPPAATRSARFNIESATRAYLADPELARRHGAAGTERVRREFESEHVWAQALALYRQLLERC